MISLWFKKRFKDAEHARSTISIACGVLGIAAFTVFITAYLSM